MGMRSNPRRGAAAAIVALGAALVLSACGSDSPTEADADGVVAPQGASEEFTTDFTQNSVPLDEFDPRLARDRQ
jgi:ABC-type glycerol-3-phosphate transport system substrate-binding protein